jgi:hypothetical protein
VKAYHWLSADMTAGRGYEPAWAVGERTQNAERKWQSQRLSEYVLPLLEAVPA